MKARRKTRHDRAEEIVEEAYGLYGGPTPNLRCVILKHFRAIAREASRRATRLERKAERARREADGL